MSERLDDVWTTRDFPVLREVTRRIDAGETPTIDHIREALSMDDATIRRAVAALERRHLVDGISGAGHGVIRFTDVSGAAYIMTGLHPDGDDALADLIAMLQQAADQAGDEEERGRLQRVLGALRDVPRDVMVRVLTAYATKYGVH
jgi:hypothetical protein